MIAIDINPIIKNYLISEGYKDISIYPINGYKDSKPPFLTWLELPSVKDVESFWMQQSTLTYSVYDIDLSRCKDIAVKVQKFLNIGDDVSSIKSSISSNNQDFRVCWVRFTAGTMFPALERDGFYSITRSFEIGYTND